MSVGDNSSNKADELIIWLRKYSKRRINSKLIDQRRCIPPHVFADLGSQGFFGLYVSKKYGGLGLQHFDIMRVLEQLAAVDVSVTMLVNHSILAAHTISASTDESIKNKYLPLLASGKIFISVGITESCAGSDPRKIRSTASPDGLGGWLLNGSKRWCCMSPWATAILVYAKQLDSNGKENNLTGFIIPPDLDGVEIGEEAITMGAKGIATCTITFTNVRLDSSHLLGEPGKGMEGAQSTMKYIRMCFGMTCIGASKQCIQLMHRYSSRRHVSTGLLLENPVTQTRLSQLITEVALIDTFTKRIAKFMDMGIEVPEELFMMSKILGSECLASAADKLIQNLGARGCEDVNIASRVYRDARAFRISEGPNEVLTMYIGRKVMGGNESLESFLSETLKLSEASDQLRQIADKVSQCSSKKAGLPFKDANHIRYWESSLMGEVSTYFFLRAVVTEVLDSEFPEDGILQHACSWAEVKLETVIDRILKTPLEESSLLSFENIDRALVGFQDNIGLIEQHAPMENVYKDPMLKLDMDESKHPELAAQDWPQVIVDWNKTDKPVPNKSIQDLFYEQALKTPNAIAVSMQEEAITYSELDKRATQLAVHLQNLGVKPEVIVGICLERSIEMIIALFAILKSGGAYLPLDPALPDHRIKYMLEDSCAPIVITHSALNKQKLYDITWVSIDKEWEGIAQSNLNDLKVYSGSKNLAYVMYTSGSTGCPKGVMIEHRALTNHTLFSASHYEISSQDNVLQFISLSFDISFVEIFPTLISGGQLVLRSKMMLDSYRTFIEELQKSCITVLVLPTAYWHQLISHVSENEIPYLETLRLILFCGEKVDVKKIKIWDDLMPKSKIKLINLYGPTEATCVSTTQTFSRDDFRRDNVFPIGKPIDNCKVYILNKGLRPVSLYAEGELCIGGIGLARGYLNRKELTAKRFVDNPFGEGKLYKTGDTVRYCKDGSLEFCGRIDNQVKIRGFRVELGEIKVAVDQNPNVKQSYVMTTKDAQGNNQIRVYIVSKEDEYTLVNDLRVDLSRILPDYMLPHYYKVLPALPLTTQGKINKDELSKFDTEERYCLTAYIPPSTDIEKKLVVLWEDALMVSRIGVNENFVDLGGHSLLAAQIASSIWKIFGVSICVHNLFLYPTIKELANYIDDLLSTGTENVGVSELCSTPR